MDAMGKRVRDSLFLAGGPLLLSRLKKVGPLELFETAAPALAKRLAELLELEKRGISPIFDEEPGPPTQVAVEEARRADTLILLFDALGQPETLTADARRSLGSLLFYVGACAVRRKHWATARERLERLQRLTGASLDRNEITYNLPFKLAYNLGRVYLGPVIDKREPREQGLTYDPREKNERKRLLRMALECFRRAVAEDPLSRDAWFNLAWVADELGLIGPTVEALETVLKLNPDDAPAKLNLAISLLKKRDLHGAFARLETISATDSDGLAILQQAMTDPDLDPLRANPSYAGRLRRFLKMALAGGAGSMSGESRA
jgi:tetratricopeptide (TPR) repeat protein